MNIRGVLALEVDSPSISPMIVASMVDDDVSISVIVLVTITSALISF